MKKSKQMSNKDIFVFYDKSHSLRKDRDTDWEYVLGDLHYLVKDMKWNEGTNEWEHSMFSLWDIVIQVLLADAKALEPIKKYIDKVSELGTQSWTKEMEV
tara:strand:+ start:1050 stop:1349 length:300 start_codon:yes stop_codon:yes gene_type:complete